MSLVSLVMSVIKDFKLSEHFSLSELCKTSVNSLGGNIPGPDDVENLKRLCPWLEELRYRYNIRYVSPPKLGGARGGLNSGTYSASSDHPAHPGSPPDSGGEEDTEEPIIITSGYRSPDVNRCVGGAYSSNHLTGCAVDIRVAGIEQALRYAVILMDYADETQQDYDELLIERNRKGHYWVHFAVRPPKRENRRKVCFIQT